jgi:hypothetical protein
MQQVLLQHSPRHHHAPATRPPSRSSAAIPAVGQQVLVLQEQMSLQHNPGLVKPLQAEAIS